MGRPQKSNERKKSETIRVSITPDLRQTIDTIAENDGKTFLQAISQMVIRGVAWLTLYNIATEILKLRISIKTTEEIFEKFKMKKVEIPEDQANDLVELKKQRDKMVEELLDKIVEVYMKH